MNSLEHSLLYRDVHVVLQMYRVAQKVSHYQVIRNRIKYQSL